ncbi:DNA cytosine methyltransferase [Paenibacillus dendritiformis]|uniref:DNA cytosine methyltransferase n=1 Tax=Paenibacillus dendritiformis TaxID=130049 RepID=UPI00143DDD55|nr:DNA cytosine methyltransferase [Paenibacillus dendritiformis]NKI23242.1 DNA cytosine methyltransferase [Paenibacillus dendritiformis]NRF98037.1 DNA cytosine methyltransferase [Paenibacillus dendritiformis]
MSFTAIDLFAGCGGLTQGLKQAGVNVVSAIEINKNAAKAYKMNHPETCLLEEDIRNISIEDILSSIPEKNITLVAGCPPCQGFSSVRTRNRGNIVEDERNTLILDFLRIVEGLRPKFVMMENVPGIINYHYFKVTVNRLKELGYHLDYKVVNVEDYGVPQRRKRLVLLGSTLGKVSIPSDKVYTRTTVRDYISELPPVEESTDPLHKVTSKHSEKVKKIISLIPKNGGSRRDLPREYWLECHKKEGVGFSDIYGRLSWDKVSSTITGGCLNPSKGRFLHPVEDRTITAREAALLQTFPNDYKFPTDISKGELAQMIGNSFPPKFSEIQALYLKSLLTDS